MPEMPEIPEELPPADEAAAIAEAMASAHDGEALKPATAAHVPEGAKENEPMLDVHPPHHPISTWREFFIHIATISIGLLIAVGLEQGVEALHRYRQLHVLEEDLRQETLTNRDWGRFNLAYIDRDMNWLLELRSRVDVVRAGGDKNLFVYPPVPEGFPGDPNHTDRRLQAVTVWNTARENAQVELLPTFDAQMYTTFYRVSDLYSDNFTALTLDWKKLIEFEFQFEDSWVPSQPDIRRMSPQQLDQYAGIISELFLEARMVRRYLQIQMAYNEAAVEHSTFPDIERYLQEHPSPLQGSRSGVVPAR
jgi:Ni/Co efflux regulator RcnB